MTQHLYEETSGKNDPFFNAVFSEKSRQEMKWGGAQSPNTIMLRKIVCLANWASEEPKRWQAYRMRYIECRKNADIAKKLGVSERTLRRYFERTRFVGLFEDLVNDPERRFVKYK